MPEWQGQKQRERGRGGDPGTVGAEVELAPGGQPVRAGRMQNCNREGSEPQVHVPGPQTAF